MKTIKHLKNLTDKKVLLRLDLNVPIVKKQVGDVFRITKSLPTIKYLLKNNATIIIVSHLGQPQGVCSKEFSLKLVYLKLKEMLPKVSMVFVADDLTKAKGLEKVKKTKQQIVFLENLRFYKAEENNENSFAKRLASLAQVYVNDAFSVCHRKNASIVAITKYLPSYAGFNLLSEINSLNQLLKPKKPAIAIIGGVKVETKFSVIEKLMLKYKYILTGGGVANLFFQATGVQIGVSVTDQKYLNQAKKIVSNDKIILPKDVIVADQKTKRKIHKVKTFDNAKLCNEEEMILDIGDETLLYYEQLLNKAKTIVWAGPLGYLDNDKFANGSIKIAKLLGRLSKCKYVCVGGGETNSVLEKLHLLKKITFVSTGGGAMLEYLQGAKLPGIEALKK